MLKLDEGNNSWLRHAGGRQKCFISVSRLTLPPAGEHGQYQTVLIAAMKKDDNNPNLN